MRSFLFIPIFLACFAFAPPKNEIKIDAVPFQKVIKKLRQISGLNIVVRWSVLESHGIEKDDEVTLRLKNIKIETLLKIILQQVGGEVELAYAIDDGVIIISTREDLSRKTTIRVYDIRDLMITVPNFKGRRINIDNIGQNQQQGGLGGGRYIRGSGGGSQGGNILSGSGNDEEPDEDSLEPIIDLIRETIDPDNWRETGGVGSAYILEPLLIVTHTVMAHHQLRDL